MDRHLHNDPDMPGVIYWLGSILGLGVAAGYLLARSGRIAVVLFVRLVQIEARNLREIYAESCQLRSGYSWACFVEEYRRMALGARHDF